MDIWENLVIISEGHTWMIRNNALLSGSLVHPFPSNVILQNGLIIAMRQFYVADTESQERRKRKTTSNAFILPKLPVRQSADFACHKVHPSFVHCQSKPGWWQQTTALLDCVLLPSVPASKQQRSRGTVYHSCTHLVSENNAVNEDSYHWECIPPPESWPTWSSEWIPGLLTFPDSDKSPLQNRQAQPLRINIPAQPTLCSAHLSSGTVLVLSPPSTLGDC